MKELNALEINQVSGGNETVAFFIILSLANLGLGIYNSIQISNLNNQLNQALDWLAFVDNWTIYHEVQLMNLPGYDKAASLTFDQAIAMVS